MAFVITADIILQIAMHPHLLGHLAAKTKLTEMHSDWIKYVWGQTPGVHTSLQGHRGSFKTTACTEIGIIYWLLFHPHDRIALLRETFTVAAETLASIVAIMKMDAIKALFEFAHKIEPKTIVCKEGKVRFNFRTKNITKEGSIDAYGIDSVPTGSHYDRILCDDIVTLTDRTSKAKRERTKISVMEILSNIIDRGKSVHFVGTPWHRDDAWEMRNAKGDLVIPVGLKATCYQTGLISEQELLNIKAVTTPSMFAANYELRHMSDEGSLFQDPVYGKWDHTVPYQWVVSHLDAKFSGDHYNALTLLSRRKDGKIQGIGWVKKEHVDSIMPWLKRTLREFRCTKIANENNPDKGYVAKQLAYSEDDMRIMRPLRVDEYAEKLNKHVKIATFGKRYWADIVWDENTDPEYMNQILDYREGQEPDDAPDGLASCLMRYFFTSDPTNRGSKILYQW